MVMGFSCWGRDDWDRGAPIGLDMVGWISKGSFKIKIVSKFGTPKFMFYYQIVIDDHYIWLYLVIGCYWVSWRKMLRCPHLGDKPVWGQFATCVFWGLGTLLWRVLNVGGGFDPRWWKQSHQKEGRGTIQASFDFEHCENGNGLDAAVR